MKTFRPKYFLPFVINYVALFIFFVVTLIVAYQTPANASSVHAYEANFPPIPLDLYQKYTLSPEYGVARGMIVITDNTPMSRVMVNLYQNNQTGLRNRDSFLPIEFFKDPNLTQPFGSFGETSSFGGTPLVIQASSKKVVIPYYVKLLPYDSHVTKNFYSGAYDYVLPAGSAGLSISVGGSYTNTMCVHPTHHYNTSLVVATPVGSNPEKCNFSTADAIIEMPNDFNVWGPFSGTGFVNINCTNRPKASSIIYRVSLSSANNWLLKCRGGDCSKNKPINYSLSLINDDRRSVMCTSLSNDCGGKSDSHIVIFDIVTNTSQTSTLNANVYIDMRTQPLPLPGDYSDTLTVTMTSDS